MFSREREDYQKRIDDLLNAVTTLLNANNAMGEKLQKLEKIADAYDELKAENEKLKGEPRDLSNRPDHYEKGHADIHVVHDCDLDKLEEMGETELNISQMNEKPKASYAEEFLGVKCKDGQRKYMSVFGQYILTPEVFAQLHEDIANSTDSNKEIELTSALDKVREREGMMGVQLQGRMFDMGNYHALCNCVKEFSK